MNFQMLKFFLTLSLSLELIVTPVLAQVGPSAPSTMPSGSSGVQLPGANMNLPQFSGGNIFSAQNLGSMMQTIGQLSQSAQGYSNPNSAADQAGLQGMMAPQPDKYFNLQKLSAIPGLGQYIAQNNINPQLLNCSSLPTTMYELKAEVCRVGVTSDKGPPAGQLAEMLRYGDAYNNIRKQYENYTKDSNADGQLFGVGCMDNAMQILNGFFNYRINELDKLATSVEALNAKFKADSQSDLNAIGEDTAVLDGGTGSDIVNEARSRRPDLFDFAKRFNNPACNSMMAGQGFSDIGNEKGLNGISKNLQETLNTQSGTYSGASYAQSNATVVADITSMADKVADQARLNFSAIADGQQGSYSQFLDSLKGAVSSTSGVNNALSRDLFADAQNAYNTATQNLTRQMSTIQTELQADGGDPSAALSMVRQVNTANFDSEVNMIQNRINNACVQRSLGSIDTLLSNNYDPTSSNFANQNAANFYNQQVSQIMSNTSTSIDKKLADLQALDTGNNRYILRRQSDYAYTDADGSRKTVSASTAESPARYISHLIANCQAQFRTNSQNGSLSPAAAITQLRNLRTQYQDLSNNNASRLKQAIVDKMINCPASASSASTTATCTPQSFNTGTPGFCARAAFTCSNNMQACSAQAKGFVTEIKNDRVVRVNNYKALVAKNKSDIIRMFDTALAKYTADGEAMRGLFGVGFSTPSPIQREVPEAQRYLDNFRQATSGSPDGALLLEDPEQYANMFKANITALKAKVKEQQDQLLSGGNGRFGGILGQHRQQTNTNYNDVVTAARTFSEQCIGKYDTYVAQMEQANRAQQEAMAHQNQELGEKDARFCRLYSMARNHSNGACNGANELTSVSLEAAGRSGGFAAAQNSLAAYCDSVDNQRSTSGGESCRGLSGQAADECRERNSAAARANQESNTLLYCNTHPSNIQVRWVLREGSTTAGSFFTGTTGTQSVGTINSGNVCAVVDACSDDVCRGSTTYRTALAFAAQLRPSSIAVASTGDSPSSSGSEIEMAPMPQGCGDSSDRSVPDGSFGTGNSSTRAPAGTRN